MEGKMELKEGLFKDVQKVLLVTVRDKVTSNERDITLKLPERSPRTDHSAQFTHTLTRILPVQSQSLASVPLVSSSELQAGYKTLLPNSILLRPAGF